MVHCESNNSLIFQAFLMAPFQDVLKMSNLKFQAKILGTRIKRRAGIFKLTPMIRKDKILEIFSSSFRSGRKNYCLKHETSRFLKLPALVHSFTNHQTKFSSTTQLALLLWIYRIWSTIQYTRAHQRRSAVLVNHYLKLFLHSFISVPITRQYTVDVE